MAVWRRIWRRICEHCGKNLSRFDSASGQFRDEPTVSGQEVVLAKLARQNPGNFLKRARMQDRFLDCHRKKYDRKRTHAAGIFVLDARNRNRAQQGNVEFLAKFPSQRLLQRFADFDLAARKFPFKR